MWSAEIEGLLFNNDLCPYLGYKLCYAFSGWESVYIQLD